MKDTFNIIILLLGTIFTTCQVAFAQTSDGHKAVLVIHGGAGSITHENLSDDRQQAYAEAMEEALLVGYEIIAGGGASLDAVVAAVMVMEDSPLFNSARGAVLTSTGTVELDASIMDGATLDAGAAAAIKHVRNPISLARAVMEQSDHVLLMGDGAEAFAEEVGLEMVTNEYFRTERRVRQYESYKEQQNEGAEETGDAGVFGEPDYYGTVGAAALDSEGNLAAATSTGGTSFKRWGRVGDSPIIGAGTYADNATCAISATGTGEYFIRGVLAYRISALMQYAGLSLREAASSVVHGTLTELGGDGGVIGLDANGNVTMTFNTEGMFRGYVDGAGNTYVAMFNR